MTDSLEIAGVAIEPGTRRTLNLPIPHLYTHTPVEMPVHIVRGNADGPVLFISGAVHGDELNGVEIIRRLMQQNELDQLQGTLVAIPIVNVYGVLNHSRYLPDRRDLNRSFPGSERGSLASRLAHLLVSEVISRCTHAIDLHTGAVHRSNTPQIRANLENPQALEMARAFGVPVVIDSPERDGSLREAAADLDIPAIIYEAGEALRLDELSIRLGLNGINNTMRSLGMLPELDSAPEHADPFVARSSRWVRAPISGILLNNTDLGDSVAEGDVLGSVADPFGDSETDVLASVSGVVVGRTHLPLVNEGDAVIHIARFENEEEVADLVHEVHDSESVRMETDPAEPLV